MQFSLHFVLKLTIRGYDYDRFLYYGREIHFLKGKNYENFNC